MVSYISGRRRSSFGALLLANTESSSPVSEASRWLSLSYWRPQLLSLKEKSALKKA